MNARRLAAVLAVAALLAFSFPLSASAGRPSPQTTVVTVVDTTSGALPVAGAAAAWSKNTGVVLTVATACGVGSCFVVQWDTAGACAVYQTGITTVGGCADGGTPCHVSVTRGIPDYTHLRVRSMPNEQSSASSPPATASGGR